MKTSKFNLYVFVVIACVVVFIYFAYNFWIIAQPKDGHIVTETIYNKTETSNSENVENVEPSETIESTEATEITKATEATISPQSPVSLGRFKLTAYCPCGECCGKWANSRPVDKNGNEIVYGATGERLVEGMSVAVDPDVIPYGTEIIINGHTYKAQDCGNGIKGNDIDIYMTDHNDALEFGVQYAEVFLAEETKIVILK